MHEAGVARTLTPVSARQPAVLHTRKKPYFSHHKLGSQLLLTPSSATLPPPPDSDNRGASASAPRHYQQQHQQAFHTSLLRKTQKISLAKTQRTGTSTMALPCSVPHSSTTCLTPPPCPDATPTEVLTLTNLTTHIIYHFSRGKTGREEYFYQKRVSGTKRDAADTETLLPPFSRPQGTLFTWWCLLASAAG